MLNFYKSPSKKKHSIFLNNKKKKKKKKDIREILLNGIIMNVGNLKIIETIVK